MKALWICMDIVGTYGGSLEKKIAFFERLDELRKLYDQDLIIFSFVSTDSIDYVEDFTREVQTIIKNFPSILLGPQIGYEHTLLPEENKYLRHRINSKGIHLLNYGEYLMNTFDIEKILYIDDNPGTNFSLCLYHEKIKKFENHTHITVIEPETQMEEEEYPSFITVISGIYKKELDYVLEGLNILIDKEKAKEKVK